ncbi:GAF sensor signal transduction histidine kinase [Filimonas lacunae]|uniref:histidine kinase n=1 Tax=Filimonas lacunae TaxID=477680 RepID=A0A173MQD2_9BACT|nr:GAF domain-containing sensor histidine kinase [Filimonas lacunae]BAV09660.1 sensor histidine kinase [Filimonas lacunae]SIS76751.1 GAF sensor signal transduction histidine kinase [Filimonas lacunae]
MIEAALPHDEQDRLQELYRTELLDSPKDTDFDEIVQLASRICDVPISLISLIDAGRQWFKAKTGIDIDETERSISFCAHAILQDDLMEVRDTSKDERFADNPFVKGDPEVRFYAGVPLVTERGYKLGTLCVIDKTPRVLTEDQALALKVLAKQIIKLIELRSRNKEIQHLVTTQNRITSIISHDVRNPLAALKAIIELQTSGALTEEETTEMLTMSSKQLDSTIDMVANVSDWGRLQMKVQRMQKVPVNLSTLIDQTLPSFMATASSKNNILNSDVPKGLVIQAEQQALHFILRNLLSNANKYTEFGSITVSAQQEESRVRLKVCDTGIGMTKEKVASIFGSEKNFPAPGTQGEKGSGLGLLLVKDFLDKINGRILITSEEGAGTCVSIIL